MLGPRPNGRTSWLRNGRDLNQILTVMILQVVVSGFLREPFREDLGIFIIWDDPPSAVGLFQALTSRVEKWETNFQVGTPNEHSSSRGSHANGVVWNFQRSRLVISKWWWFSTGVSQNSPSFGFRKYCNLPRMMEASMSFCC